MKNIRLTTRINGYAHGKRGTTLSLAMLQKDFHRGCFECTAIVEKLCELEEKIESGELVFVKNIADTEA